MVSTFRFHDSIEYVYMDDLDALLRLHPRSRSRIERFVDPNEAPIGTFRLEHKHVHSQLRAGERGRRHAGEHSAVPERHIGSAKLVLFSRFRVIRIEFRALFAWEAAPCTQSTPNTSNIATWPFASLSLLFSLRSNSPKKRRAASTRSSGAASAWERTERSTSTATNSIRSKG